MSVDVATHQVLPVADARATAGLAWRLVRVRWLGVGLTVLSFLAAGLTGIVPVLMIGRIVDVVTDGGASADVTRAVVVALVAGLGTGLFTAASAVGLAHVVAPALAELREEVLDRVLHLEGERVEAAGTGDVLGRVSDDVRRLTEALDEAIPLLLWSLSAIVFTVGGLFSLDWRLGLAGLTTVPFYAWALRWYLPKSAPFYRAERRAEGERADALVTGVRGASTLRAVGAEQVAMRRIEQRSSAAVDITVGVFRLFTRFGSRMNWTECLGLIMVLGTGFVLVRTGSASVGEATAAALFFHRLFNPVGALLFVFDAVQASGAALARLAGVALMPAEAPVPDQQVGPASLHVRGVRHSYESGREVLAPVDLDVAPGERVAIVGATGAGKTTLGGIVAGAVAPTAGSVRLGSLDVVSAPPRLVRRHVALVSQEVHVFAGTVRDNLLLAHPDADDDALWSALDAAMATAWVRALPDGLGTQVGDLGHPLTAAQSQQLALARVHLLDPQLVVLDEATAEAGSAGARGLELAADRVTHGRSAIVIAHRLTQARAADRVLVMDAGVVVEEGTHAELVAAGGRYARLWAAWSDTA